LCVIVLFVKPEVQLETQPVLLESKYVEVLHKEHKLILDELQVVQLAIEHVIFVQSGFKPEV